jgi:PAS domain S-box-containing protein
MTEGFVAHNSWIRVLPKPWSAVSRGPRWLRKFIVAGLYILIYVGLDRISTYSQIFPSLSAWYMPVGLTMALLLGMGLEYAPAAFAASLLTAVLNYQLPIFFSWSAFPLSLAFVAGYTLTAAFIIKVLDFDITFKRGQDVVRFVLATLAGSLIVAVLGVSCNWLDGVVKSSEYLPAMLNWWLGDAVALNSLSPLLLLFFIPRIRAWVNFGTRTAKRLNPIREIPSGLRLLEVPLQGASVILAVWVVFGLTLADLYRPLYLCFIPIVWIAVRHGTKGVAVGIFAFSSGLMVALRLTGSTMAGVQRGQILAISLCLTGMILGAVVSERRLVGEGLRQSEDRYRDLVENSGIFVGTQDLEGNVLTVNVPALRMFGCAREEDMIGHNLTEFMFEEDIPQTKSYFEAIRKKGRANGLMKVKTRDGQKKIIEFNNSLRQEGVDQSIIRCIGHDVTERTRVEKALRFSEERVRLLLDSTAEAIYGIDQLGICTFANAACARMLGYLNPDGILGKNMHDLIHHTRADGTANILSECKIHQAITRGVGSHVDNEVLWRGDGTSFAAEYWSYPIQSGGTVVGSVVTFIDITERKRAEERQSQLTSILEATTDLVGIADLQGKLIYANQAGRKMVGIGENESLSALTLVSFLPADFKSLVLFEGIPAALRGGAWSGETVFMARSGKEIPVSQVILCHKSPDGTPKFLSTIARDITERKRAEADLRQAKEIAEAANRAKSDFLANMSHEIRTPMNGIMGMTELVLDTPLNAEQREYLEIVKSSTGSLLGVINDILDFSKIEAGKLDLDPIEFNLQEVMEEATRHLTVKAGEKGLEFLLEISPDTPAVVVGDPMRLRQILVNLVGNAVKFTERGKIMLSVQKKSQSSGSVVLQFSVRDSGIGIAMDRQKLIFEPFTQADGSTTRKHGGTGLGLTITSRLVQLMGGHVWVESHEDAGSVFHFTASFGLETAVAQKVSDVPAQAATGISLKPFTEAQDRSQNQESPNQLRILLAEDNPTNSMVAARVLEKHGHQIVAVSNGREALARLGETGTPEFDVILMDIQMPEMDGLEATATIRAGERATGKHIPIIALTAHAMMGDRERYLRAGMDGYVSKPIDTRRLEGEILSVVQALRPNTAGLTIETPDSKDLLARLEGDINLLAESAGIFLKFCPEYMEDIRKSVANGDASGLEGAAYRLKSSVSNFDAKLIVKSAQELETMGREENLDRSGVVLRELEDEIDRLKVSLVEWARGVHA